MGKSFLVAFVMTTVVACVMSASVDGPRFTFDQVDPFCVNPVKLIPLSDCESQTTIWTFDMNEKMCKTMTGCFLGDNQEHNVFPSEIGCNLWCSMMYERK